MHCEIGTNGLIEILFFSSDTPVVEVKYKGDIVTCTSDANPPATSHVIIVNGTVQDTQTCSDGICTLPLKTDYDTDIRCNATNSVDTGTAMALEEPGISK